MSHFPRADFTTSDDEDEDNGPVGLSDYGTPDSDSEDIDDLNVAGYRKPWDAAGKRPPLSKSGQHGSGAGTLASNYAVGSSFGTVNSLSTIRGSEKVAPEGMSPDEMQGIYSELQDINLKMKTEFKVLHERDVLLKEKERLLLENEEALSRDKSDFELLVMNEVKRRISLREQEHQIELEKQQVLMKEKIREHKRLKENFDTLVLANDTLKKELEHLQKSHTKLEKQSTSVQARLSNLQRRRDAAERKESEFLPSDLMRKPKPAEHKDSKQSSKLPKVEGVYDVLSVLLEWVAEMQLRPAISEQPTKPLESTLDPNFLQDKCLKVFPVLVEIVRDLPSTNQKLVLPCLQFIYWSLLHMDQTHSIQKSNLTSTLRRLGEELYKPRTIKFSDDEKAPAERLKDNVFFRSSHLHIRFLSSLIILKTISQVDHVAHTFEVLRADLKNDGGKELFLYYQATPVLIPYLKPSNKALLNSAIDVYLHMTMESAMLNGFLETCSNETWFRSCSMLFRTPNLDDKLVEKLSIILQKLSKLKINRRYFEVFGLTTACQEMLRTVSNTNAFLTLNLKSILFNLNTKTPSSASASINSSQLSAISSSTVTSASAIGPVTGLIS